MDLITIWIHSVNPVGRFQYHYYPAGVTVAFNLKLRPPDDEGY